MRRNLRATVALLITHGLVACASVPTLPPADLSDPAWEQHRGQAVWQPADQSRPRLIGDLLLATRDDALLVNFVKPPIPLFTARVQAGQWSIRFVERGRAYGGGGRPPAKRFIWFALPAILDGAPPPKPWLAERPRPGVLQLTQPKSGETLRVVLPP